MTVRGLGGLAPAHSPGRLRQVVSGSGARSGSKPPLRWSNDFSDQAGEHICVKMLIDMTASPRASIQQWLGVSSFRLILRFDIPRLLHAPLPPRVEARTHHSIAVLKFLTYTILSKARWTLVAILVLLQKLGITPIAQDCHPKWWQTTQDRPGLDSRLRPLNSLRAPELSRQLFACPDTRFQGQIRSNRPRLPPSPQTGTPYASWPR